MPSNKFDLMVGKALLDPDYQAKLLDPKTREAALKDIGVTHPTQEQLDAIENAKGTLEDLSGVFSGTGAA